MQYSYAIEIPDQPSNCTMVVLTHVTVSPFHTYKDVQIMAVCFRRVAVDTVEPQNIKLRRIQQDVDSAFGSVF